MHNKLRFSAIRGTRVDCLRVSSLDGVAVFLNGEQVEEVQECMVGQSGFVKRLRLKDGKPFLHRDHVATERLNGHVEVRFS